MRALQFSEYGGPEVLTVAEAPEPHADPGQIRIEFVVDHNGTPTDPSDDILLSETLVKGSTGRSDDFCEVVVPALG